MITVLVADDHPVVRSGVRNLLKDEPDIRIAAEAKTAAETMQQVQSRDFDVILLDIALPDANGIDLIERLRKHSPHSRIVMFTNAADEVKRSLEAGAVAFVSKDAPAEELKEAIHAAADGRVFVASRAARHLDSGDAPGQRETARVLPHDSLTRRELEIMLKLMAGRRNKEISLELDISEKTVATHRSRLLKKLGVDDIRGLILYGMRHGLTDWSA